MEVGESEFQGCHLQVGGGYTYMYIYACLSGLWLGGLLHLSFLSDFLKLVCYAHVFPCIHEWFHYS